MSASSRVRVDAPPAKGRIITFYSYKGGTGRSMALANVAWILACNGARVLVIDWDLEAPGLHRYFRPFLSDPELSRTPGLIDFFVHFTEAACIEGNTTSPSRTETAWFEDRADVARYATALEYEFPNDGLLDFVGAGQQGPSYSTRVNSFQWNDFYEKLGGGVFLEAVKQTLRAQYDYVLIDSRTGLSDTSGICTVQMPDELVVCFTLNHQSIFGAVATAQSVDAQRRLPTGEPSLRIWPVPTRVELHEKDRLETARAVAREQFAPLLWHIPVGSRAEYWGAIEVLYFPYYAYEEVLATIADAPLQKASLLRSMEQIASQITRAATTMPQLRRGEREQLLARYEIVPASGSRSRRTPRFFLSYAAQDESRYIFDKLAAMLEARFGADAVFWDKKVPLGASIRSWLAKALDQADVVIVAIGPRWRQSGSVVEVETALSRGKAVVPVLVNGADFPDLPESLRDILAVRLTPDTLEPTLQRLITDLSGLEASRAGAIEAIDVDDPHRGQFGGSAEAPDRRFSAQVSPSTTTPDWFKVDLSVEGHGPTPLAGEVEFHLHPTFKPSIVRIPAQDGKATLTLSAWGGFTAGAVADNGLTRLELNLAALSNLPEEFAKR
jgi:cellulose biosynthesis protein BcsQ